MDDDMFAQLLQGLEGDSPKSVVLKTNANVENVMVQPTAQPIVEKGAPQNITIMNQTSWLSSIFQYKLQIGLCILIVCLLLTMKYKLSNRTVYEGRVLGGPTVLISSEDPLSKDVKKSNINDAVVSSRLESLMTHESVNVSDTSMNQAHNVYNAAHNAVQPNVDNNDANIVPVHGSIPIWAMPDDHYDTVEARVSADNTSAIDQIVKAREQATKDLEAYMAQGLKNLGLPNSGPT